MLQLNPSNLIRRLSHLYGHATKIFSALCKNIIIGITCLVVVACGEGANDGGTVQGNNSESPTNFQASANNDGITLSWRAVNNIDYYEIYRSTSPDGTGRRKIANPLALAGTSYTDNSMIVNTTYYYWLKACTSDGQCSAFSSAAGPIQWRLSTPSDVQAKAEDSASQITLSWSSVKTSDYYEVYRSTSSDGTNRNKIANSLASSGTSYTDISIIVNTNYYYWIRACTSDDQCSDFSSMGGPIQWILSAPSSINATANDSTLQIKLLWQSVAVSDYYEVYRSTSYDGTGRSKIVSSLASSGTSYNDNRIIANTTYYYWLKACILSGNQCSDFSSTVGPIQWVLSAPSNVNANADGSTTYITLSWDSVDVSGYYEVYRSTSFDSTGRSKIASLLASVVTSYIDNNIMANTTYYYWLKACISDDQNQCSDFSSSAFLLEERGLNDTGITWGGNYRSGNQSSNTCSPTGFSTDTVQDCHLGRDAQAVVGTLVKVGGGNAGFDFTKLSSAGTALAIQNSTWSNSGSESAGTKWSCVIDNHTGLVWEIKTDDGGIHDKDNTYRWGGKTAIGRGQVNKEGTYYDAWDSLVDGSNNANLCGFSDWRVPTINELDSIADKGRINPSIDSHYFPNTLSSLFWSASPYARWSDLALLLQFRDGYNLSISRGRRHHLRLVRSSQLASVGPSALAPVGSSQTIKAYIDNEWHDSRYTVHNDGTVTDKVTKLMWKVCSEGQNWSRSGDTASCSGSAATTWKGALQRVNSYTFAGYSDWRVPNINELRSLAAYDRYSPAINLTIFPNTPSNDFWSASPYVIDSGSALQLYFGYGNDGSGFRNSDGRVRLVRSSQ